MLVSNTTRLGNHLCRYFVETIGKVCDFLADAQVDTRILPCVPARKLLYEVGTLVTTAVADSPTSRVCVRWVATVNIAVLLCQWVEYATVFRYRWLSFLVYEPRILYQVSEVSGIVDSCLLAHVISGDVFLEINQGLCDFIWTTFFQQHGVLVDSLSEFVKTRIIGGFDNLVGLVNHSHQRCHVLLCLQQLFFQVLGINQQLLQFLWTCTVTHVFQFQRCIQEISSNFAR